MMAKDWIVNRDTRTSLLLLLAAVILLLLTTCANVAGLLVTRATARTHEFSVRLALGARRRRLLRQLTTESLVLALTGGTLGVLIGTVAVKWLATRVTNQLPRAMNITVDWPVLAFAFGLIVAIGLVFGLAPSWSTRHVDVITPLRRGGRGTVGTTGARLRLALAGGQVALATILVVGALLLIQSLARLQEVDLGFQPDHLLAASLNLPIAKYPNPEKAEAFYRNLISEIKALPGVVNAGLTSAIPMSGGNTSMAIVPVDRPSSVPERGIEASWRWVNADYLRTLRVPLRRGRLFEDTEWKLQSIVLSETLARLLWPDGSDPIGRQVKLVNGSEYTVGGVVGDVRMIDRREEPEPAMYFSPFFFETLTVVVRATGHPAELTHALRDAVRRIDPEQPVFNIRTMDEVLAANAERSRLETTLLSAFACLALLLGTVGIAGVVAYTVERRAPDLAVRLVLGATPVAAMRSATRGALRSSVIGLIVGLFAASSLSGLLANVLYGVKPNDPATFAAVGISLFFVALLACWIPARRVSRIDPAVALKRQ
jgi:predicted permease